MSFINILILIIIVCFSIFFLRWNFLSILRISFRNFNRFQFIYIICFIFTLILQIYLPQTNFLRIIGIFGLFSYIINTFYILYRPPEESPKIMLKKLSSNHFNVGKVYLGKILSNQNIFGNFNLDIEDLKRHIIIYGQTGTGKTTFVKNLLINLSAKYPDIKFILFEFKGEYNDMTELNKDIMLIKPGANFVFDIFENDIFPPDQYPEILFDSFKSCQILNESAEYSPQMEFLLISALKTMYRDNKTRNWNLFFKTLDGIMQKNVAQIPQLGQTIIGIKNRLRRYYDGPLRNIFLSTENSLKLSYLMNKNCIIDLGYLLKLGGSKEDVIFFANLILKWIWQFNMLKEPVEDLKHITIFEDCSYISSKKLLESSKITTYLEDIALLLRGKGEALITVSTTLDISRNIVLNAGSKFFFKFNEKVDDVAHYLGLLPIQIQNISELITGYCIAKIDSIPEAFLLRVDKFKTLRKKKGNQLKIQKNQSSISNIASKETKAPTKNQIENILLNSETKMENEEKKYIPVKNQDENYFLILVYYLKGSFEIEKYFEVGNNFLSNLQEIQLLNQIKNQGQDFTIKWENYSIFRYNLELDSYWNQNLKENLMIIILFSFNLESFGIIEFKMKNLCDIFQKKLNSIENIFKAIYLTHSEKRRTNKNEIEHYSMILKHQIIDFSNHIKHEIQEKQFETNSSQVNLTENAKLDETIQRLIIQENKNLINNFNLNKN